LPIDKDFNRPGIFATNQIEGLYGIRVAANRASFLWEKYAFHMQSWKDLDAIFPKSSSRVLIELVDKGNLLSNGRCHGQVIVIIAIPSQCHSWVAFFNTVSLSAELRTRTIYVEATFIQGQVASNDSRPTNGGC
jgi:hypothetical protein